MKATFVLIASAMILLNMTVNTLGQRQRAWYRGNVLNRLSNAYYIGWRW